MKKVAAVGSRRGRLNKPEFSQLASNSDPAVGKVITHHYSAFKIYSDPNASASKTAAIGKGLLEKANLVNDYQQYHDKLPPDLDGLIVLAGNSKELMQEINKHPNVEVFLLPQELYSATKSPKFIAATSGKSVNFFNFKQNGADSNSLLQKLDDSFAQDRLSQEKMDNFFQTLKTGTRQLTGQGYARLFSQFDVGQLKQIISYFHAEKSAEIPDIANHILKDLDTNPYLASHDWQQWIKSDQGQAWQQNLSSGTQSQLNASSEIELDDGNNVSPRGPSF